MINAGGNTMVWGGSTPSPAVMQAMAQAGDRFVVNVHTLNDGAEQIIADRMREVLG